MKTTSSAILRYFCVAAVVATGLSNSAWATIGTMSNKIQYGTENTYFAYVSLNGADTTWDEVEADVEALPTYNGLSAHLAVFNTEESYDWMVAHYSSFTGVTPGQWDQGWIGAFNNAGTYEWLGGAGTIDSNSPHWNDTWNPLPQPNAANYGVVWMFGTGGTYGDVWSTQPSNMTMGNAVIQYGYAAVPEPGTWALLVGAGGLFALLKRRASRKA
jgi:hypothetical protein